MTTTLYPLAHSPNAVESAIIDAGKVFLAITDEPAGITLHSLALEVFKELADRPELRRGTSLTAWMAKIKDTLKKGGVVPNPSKIEKEIVDNKLSIALSLHKKAAMFQKTIDAPLSLQQQIADASLSLLDDVRIGPPSSDQINRMVDEVMSAGTGKRCQPLNAEQEAALERACGKPRSGYRLSMTGAALSAGGFPPTSTDERLDIPPLLKQQLDRVAPDPTEALTRDEESEFFRLLDRLRQAGPRKNGRVVLKCLRQATKGTAAS
jgi:hypothetical protein